MRTGHRPSRRGGFTLIELLIVIGILALLAALTAAGIGRIREGQHASSTESTMKKAQEALEQQQRTVYEEAYKAGNQHVTLVQPYADNDLDRAKAFVHYLNAKREFPQTFAEARAGLTIPGVSGAYPPHRAFAEIPAGASGLTADQESAVLLYMIVLGKGNKGANSTEEAFSGATGKVTSTNGRAWPVLTDGYGTHLAFVRWYGPYNGAFSSVNGELQMAPFVNPKDQAPTNPQTRGSVDRFDPMGKLALASWPISLTTNRTAALVILNAPAGSPPVAFDGLNKVMTVVSAGKDKTFNTPDDVFGFKLGQFGGKPN